MVVVFAAPGVAVSEENLYYIFKSVAPDLDRGEWSVVWSELSWEARDSLMRAFTTPTIPASVVLLKRALVRFSNGLPLKQRRKLFRMIKLVRKHLRRRIKAHELFGYDGSVGQGVLSRIGRDRISVQPAVILTYDLDLPSCLEGLDASLEQLDKFGLHATYNILTGADYQFDRAVVERIRRCGHDVGLHGHTHDLDYGVKSPSELDSLFSKSLATFGEGVMGFRSPALSKGANLYSALQRFGFRFDSSFTVQHPFYGGTGIPFPYLMHEVPLVQYPILFQDNVFFSDLGFDDEEALGVAVPLVRRCAESGGVAVLNLHLCLENSHSVFHEKLLESISTLSVPSMSMMEHYMSSHLINEQG